MPVIVFVAVLVVGLLGAMAENAYHAGDVRATGILSGLVNLTQGLVAFAVVADRSLPNLIAASLAWSLAMAVGCHWKRRNA